MTMLSFQVVALSCTPNNDFQWLVDRTSLIYLSGDSIPSSYPSSMTHHHSSSGSLPAAASTGLSLEQQASAASAAESPWVECISVFMHPDFVTGKCPTAVSHAWPILYARLRELEDHVGPK